MGRDIQDLSFLGPRIMDKLVLALIIMSLYWRVGANTAPSNVNNITAVLFLWTILPGYAAASYMPSIVLERPLFVRCAPAPGMRKASLPHVVALLDLRPNTVEGSPYSTQGSEMAAWVEPMRTTCMASTSSSPRDC